MTRSDRVPRCMSTQHPDNATVPFFVDGPVMDGVDEIREAYYAFSHLGCDEQMWDFEGKEVDEFVVEKLFSTYAGFFRTHVLGKDMRLTPRAPNPSVEKGGGKILLEVLHWITRTYDVASLFYGNHVHPPISEIILPMTTSATELDRILRYYETFILGLEDTVILPGDRPLKEWIGEFHPKRIAIIPLIEDRDSLLRVDTIVGEYLRDKQVPYQRVFLARSDPALNYGMLAAVLLVKVALARLDRLERRLGIPIYPILGAGSAPFRGNLRPDTVDRILREYPSVQTYTIQSAFKYDHPATTVVQAIQTLRATPRGPAHAIDAETAIVDLIDRIATCYQAQVRVLAPVVNLLASHVPRRRMRRLHIGLFGYSRNVGGIRLPRAITYCAALYSVGLPPELLGLAHLQRTDLALIRTVYPGFEHDLHDAVRYFNPRALDVLFPDLTDDVQAVFTLFDLDPEPDPDHRDITTDVIRQIAAGNGEDTGDLILQAAWVRRFLG